MPGSAKNNEIHGRVALLSGTSVEKLMQNEEAFDMWHLQIRHREKMRLVVELVGDKGRPTRHTSRTDWKK